jgi:hypothetical protein
MEDRVRPTRVWKLKQLYLYSVAIIAVITLPIFLSLVREKMRVERTFENYCVALQREDYKSAYTYTTSAFREETSYQEFVAQQREAAAAHGRLLELQRSLDLVSYEGLPPHWKAKISAVHKYQNVDLPVLYEWRKENGEWKIFGYRVQG